MILEINNLNEIIVRVNGGSGVILKFESDRKCYVLTACHNIEDFIEYNEKIELLNDKNKPYTLVEKPYFDKDNDFALFEIEYINKDIPIVKYEKTISPDDKIIFMGYPDKGEEKRKDLSGKVNEWNRTKTSIKVLEENIQGSFIVKEKTNEVIVGFSGSGVFKKDGQKLSLIGILKSLPEEDFDYKEISCVPIEKILSFIQNNQLGNLSAFEKLHDLIYEKQQHTKRVLFNIHTEIKFNSQIIELDRTKEIEELENKILDNQVLILTGVGGVGKTAIIKKLYEQKKDTIPFYVFKASEFDLSLIDNLFGKYNLQKFIDIHKEYKQKTMVIDSAEKLLDIDNLDPFNEFISALIQKKWHIIFTTRDSYLEDLQYRFSGFGLKVPILTIKNLTSKELLKLSNKYNFLLSEDIKLNELIENPFYLNEYLRFYKKDEGLDYQRFKDKLWNMNIKKSKPKREECFLDLSFKRAKKGNFFVKMKCSSNSLDLLHKDGIIGYENRKYFITHDIYEEWALERIINEAFLDKKNNKKFFKKIGTFLPIRRSFRNWVSEKLLLDSDDIKTFIEEVMDDNEIEQFWKDEIFVSVLLSDYSDTFFEKFERELLADDYTLLNRISFLLRIACKEADNSFFKQYNFNIDMISIFTISSKAKGNGWKSFIAFVYKHIDTIKLENIDKILPILYDWNLTNKKGEITRFASLIVLEYYKWINQEQYKYSYDEHIDEICNVIISGTNEIKEELKLIFDEIINNKWKDREDNYYRLSILTLSTYKGLPRAFPILENMPEYVLMLAGLFWTKQLIKEENDNWYNSNDRGEVEDAYGLDDIYELQYFPSSAYQTPIYYMLKNNFSYTIDFLLEFINKSVEKYAQSEWENISEITFEIDKNKEVKQYHSQALWDIYRGTSSPVSPYLMQSIHMALEKYLLEIGKILDTETLEGWLRYILLKSKSSSISAVISSIILAYPNKTFNVAKILFKVKEFIQADFIRRFNDESEAKSLYSLGYSLNRSKVYQDERLKTCDDKHRNSSLESVFLNYQLFRTDEIDEQESDNRQKELWKILDNYYAQLPSEKEQSESDKSWRIALSRMDRRKMDIQVKKVEKGLELTFNGDLSPELQEYSDKSQENNLEKFKYTKLYLWSKYRLENNQEYKKYQEFEENHLLAIQQLKEILKINYNKEDFILQKESIPNTAIVLLKDFSKELSEKDKKMCKEIILEFSVLPFRKNYSYQLSDGSSSAILHLPIILEGEFELVNDVKMILLFNVFKDYEIGMSGINFHDYPLNAIINYYDEKEIENFLLGYLFLKSKYDTFYWKIRKENYGVNESEVREKFFEKYNEEITKFINSELKIENIDFNLNVVILSMTLKFIQFPKVKPNDIFKEVSKEFLLKVFQPKKREEKLLDGLTKKEKIREIFLRGQEEFEEIKLTIKQRLFKNLPHLIFKLDTNEAKKYLQPLLNNFRAREDIAYLLLGFIRTQDRLNEYDKFWNIWYLFENKIIEVCQDGEYSYTDKIIQTYLLAWSPYGAIWKSEAKDWHTIKERDKRFFKRISEKIGHCPSTLYSISKLLTGIGSSYLNDGIGWISYMVKNNKNLLTDKLEPDTIFNLNIITRKYVLQNSQEIKKNKSKKEEILEVLNFLVEKGSAIGYMLRERVL